LEPVLDLSELLPKALLSTRADAIIAADREGIIRFWGRGAQRIFGHSAAEALGCSLDLIIPERLRQRHWAGFGHTMETGESRYADSDVLSVPALRKDGSTISVEFTIVPLKDEAGRMLGMAAIMRDATKRFEELRALKRKLSSA
jgi:PAS domain S-box-containing protein